MVWDARCQPQMCQRTGMSFQGPVLIVPVSAAVKLRRFFSPHLLCGHLGHKTVQTCPGRHHLKRVHQLNKFVVQDAHMPAPAQPPKCHDFLHFEG